MKNNKILSITKQYHLTYFGIGLTWIFSGFLGFFDNLLCITLKTILLTANISIIIYLSISKKEDDDEMSLQNLYKAKAHSLDIMSIIVATFTMAYILISKLFADSFDYYGSFVSFVFLFIGIKDLAVGYIFHKLEED